MIYLTYFLIAVEAVVVLFGAFWIVSQLFWGVKR